MRLSRAPLRSLLVIALALAGAAVAPSRHLSRAAASIVWQAEDPRQAPVTRQTEQRSAARLWSGAVNVAALPPQAIQPFVRHQLYQRPPPGTSSDTRIS